MLRILTVGCYLSRAQRMYLYRHDERAGLAVWLLDKATNADLEAHFVHLRRIPTWATEGGRRVAAVLITNDFARPEARLRTELGRLIGTPGYNPYVAFVSPNVVVRAMLRMFLSFLKERHYETGFFASTAGALAWLDLKRGGTFALAGMIRDLQSEYAKLGGHIE